MSLQTKNVDKDEFELKRIDCSDSNVVDIFIKNLLVVFYYFGIDFMQLTL